MIIKQLAAVAAVSSLAAPAAFAGPYVNIESNSGFEGGDYNGSVIDNHIGYENTLGDSAAWYIQGGPAIVSPDGGDVTTELSGKVGIGVAVTDRLGVYGELAAMTQDEINFDEDLDLGAKLGVKFNF